MVTLYKYLMCIAIYMIFFMLLIKCAVSLSIIFSSHFHTYDTVNLCYFFLLMTVNNDREKRPEK